MNKAILNECFDQHISNFAEISNARYTSSDPKIMYMVFHDILNTISIKRFGFIKKEQSRIFGWVWENDRIKTYQSFIVEGDNNSIGSYKLKFFNTKQAAEEYALWLVINGGKMKNVI